MSPTTSNPTVTIDTTPGIPKEGSVDGVAYYHCSATATENVHHLVLLHGASFTKENWNQGILDQFCAVPQVSVTPLDLSAYAGNDDLRSILDSLEASSDVQVSKPVVLVTPSASGYTIVDWITNGDVSLIPEYIETWVPIASGSLSSATDQQVQSLGDLPVLAIYGNGDSGGVKVSQRLGDLVGATVVELVGGHSVYLDQPDDFVNEVLSFLGINNRRL
jgi:pimeloyl-ACP methyl ester carboxylesterase